MRNKLTLVVIVLLVVALISFGFLVFSEDQEFIKEILLVSGSAGVAILVTLILTALYDE